MRLALAVSRSRELQKELDAAEASGGRGLSLPEAAQLPGWLSAHEMGIVLEQGRAARATLYERNLGLAHKGAYSYYTHSDRSVPYPDLVQVCTTIFLRLQSGCGSGLHPYASRAFHSIPCMVCLVHGQALHENWLCHTASNVWCQMGALHRH